MDASPLRYRLDLEGQSFPLRAVSGVEAMSAPFSLTLRLGGDGLPAEPEALLRRVATVVLARDEEHARTITGLVTEAAVSGAVRGLPEVRLVVEPPLALLRHRTDIRVFRD